MPWVSCFRDRDCSTAEPAICSTSSEDFWALVITSERALVVSVEQISEVVQTNASTAEKSAASARELNDQAAELKLSVQKFRLRAGRKRW